MEGCLYIYIPIILCSAAELSHFGVRVLQLYNQINKTLMINQ